MPSVYAGPLHLKDLKKPQDLKNLSVHILRREDTTLEPTREEIEDQIDLAGSMIERLGISYTDGVVAALRWVMGYEEAPPPFDSE
jgi:hypothetical protein